MSKFALFLAVTLEKEQLSSESRAGLGEGGRSIGQPHRPRISAQISDACSCKEGKQRPSDRETCLGSHRESVTKQSA